MDTKKKTQMLMFGLLVAVAGYSLAQEQGTFEDQKPAIYDGQALIADENAIKILSDRLHHITQNLESSSAVHRYSFTSARGQNVLLATSNRESLNRTWKLEYRKDGAEWIVRQFGSPELFSSLQPGTKIEIRISPAQGTPFQPLDYHVIFGSAPRMIYDLQHDEGLLKMPFKLTEPTFLGTQAMTNTLLDVTFTDSKGYPLQGGVVDFELELTDPKRYLYKTLVSDSSGKAQELLQIGACEGGTYAGTFIQRHNGINTWSTRYKTGKYFAKCVRFRPHL
jgi:hypothetical protein